MSTTLRTQFMNHLQLQRDKNELIFPGNTSCYASREAFDDVIQSLAQLTWIVYAKRPFAGPEQVLKAQHTSKKNHSWSEKGQLRPVEGLCRSRRMMKMNETRKYVPQDLKKTFEPTALVNLKGLVIGFQIYPPIIQSP